SGVRSLALHQTMDLSHLNPIGAKEFPPVFEARQECNTMRAMDHLINGTYPLKAVIMSGANPMISSPNVAKVKAGLEKLDLLVVRELFMTETAELADYVLPAASFMERSEVHVHVPVHVINVTNRLFTIPGVDDEYTFLHELALRLD
ncbi:MAG: molybdopterin-dependent oxidoreductase, partial [Clostridiales bacterium]